MIALMMDDLYAWQNKIHSLSIHLFTDHLKSLFFHLQNLPLQQNKGKTI